MISIIIPCYNCAKTLEEAVESVYRQNLKNFEIILVNDKSTDNTSETINKLKNKYPEIRSFDNKKNIGGGATRNRAVKESRNEIIFCLDSDDLLGDNTLPKMIKHLSDKKLDAVCFHKKHNFTKNINKITKHFEFGYVNENIPIESLFRGKPSGLYNVCMFTKKAFEIMGGYPENHGFDTQGFAFRFLLNNLRAQSTKDSLYIQRDSNKSYYIREYENGKVNHNWYHVFEEFLFVFEEEIKKIILNFDLNSGENIFEEIKKQKNIFKTNCTTVKPDSNNIYDLYWIAYNNYKKQNFLKAQEIFEKLVDKIPNNMYIHYYLQMCTQHTNINSDKINHQKIKNLFSYRKNGSELNIFFRIIRKISKIIKK